LSQSGRRQLIDDGSSSNEISEARSVDLRYLGQSFTLTVPWGTTDEAARTFNTMHEARYGHALDLPVELVNIRTQLTAPGPTIELPRLPARPAGHARTRVEVAGRGTVAVYERDTLSPQQRIDGPAIVVETMATTFIDPLWQATVDPWGHLRLAAKRPANEALEA
jgi:N-methylhydantoinase A